MYIKLHKFTDKKRNEIHNPHENLTTISYSVNSYITVKNTIIPINCPAGS